MSHSATTRDTRSRTYGRVIGAGIFAVVLAAYWNSLSAPFIFDDYAAVVNNTTITRLWPPWSALMPPSSGEGVSGRPLVNLSLAINYAVHGLSVPGYHVANILIHAATALVLYFVVASALRLRRGILPPSIEPEMAAGLITLFWSAHPLLTESVTCVVQRNESMVGFFYLLTLWAFIRSVSSLAPRRWLAASVVACFLGVASKEVMVTAPVVVLAFDAIFVAKSWGRALRERATYYGVLASSWVLLVALVWSTGGRGGTVGFGLGQSSWHYALTQAKAIPLYFSLSLWPHPLVVDYGNDLVTSLTNVWLGAFGVVAAVAAVAVGLWRKSPWAFVVGTVFVILSPSSSFVPLTTQTMAEHRMYLPLMGVMILLVLGLVHCVGRSLLLPALVAIVAFVAITVARNADYHSEAAIWADTVAKAPTNPRAHLNHGMQLAKAGKIEAAIASYREALQLRPDYAEALNNLGALLITRGQPAEALALLTRATAIKSDYAEAHRHAGLALVRLGRLEEGLAAFDRALSADSQFAGAHYDRGTTLASLGQTSSAILEFETALRLKPNFPEALVNLGVARFNLQQYVAASTCFVSALKLNPANAEAHNNLAITLESLGRVHDAIPHYQEALRLNPANPECEYNLALALLATGRATEAQAHHDSARRLKPGLPALPPPPP